MTPPAGSPAYLAMKLYLNADGHGPGFGETSVAARAPDPDHLAVFAALRARDGALTVVAINKDADADRPVSIALDHFACRGRVTGVRLSRGRLAEIAGTPYGDGTLSAILPPQSITLFELHPDGRYVRDEPGDKPFNLHRYFMINPSLSERGAALAESGAVPTLALRRRR